MRIIAGAFRGRRLLAPIGRDTTRPITDRVKESLFGTISGWMDAAAVTDLFCGTGSLGLESLSRGARHVWFADADREALARLERNLATVGAAERATIWPGDIERRLPVWLDELPGKLDVAFLDPPYKLTEQWLAEPARVAPLFDVIATALADDGLVVFRTPAALPVASPSASLEVVRRREYGSTALHYLQHCRQHRAK